VLLGAQDFASRFCETRASRGVSRWLGEGVPTETEIFPDSALASNRQKSIAAKLFSHGFPQRKTTITQPRKSGFRLETLFRKPETESRNPAC
jgi:hypothetical protein